MKKALIYSFVLCLFSWVVYYLFIWIWGGNLMANGIAMTALKSIYMLFPMLVALVFQAVGRERPASTGLLRLNPSWTWLAAIGCVVATVALTVLTSALVPGVSIHYGADQLIAMNGLEGEMAESMAAQLGSMPPAAILGSTLISGIIAGCTINAAFAFGEEYGWRNYMVHALRGQRFWTAAIFIGLVWGIWHAPLVLAGHNYPQHPMAGVAMMCVFCVLWSIVELYFTLKTGSVAVAAIIHGTINAIAASVLILVNGGNDLTVGLTGAAGFISTALLICALRIYDKKTGGDIMGSQITRLPHSFGVFQKDL